LAGANGVKDVLLRRPTTNHAITGVPGETDCFHRSQITCPSDIGRITSFPYKSITSAAIHLCSSGPKGNDFVPLICLKARASVGAFRARHSFSQAFLPPGKNAWQAQRVMASQSPSGNQAALSLPSVVSRSDYNSSGEFGQTGQGRGCLERSEGSVRRHSPNNDGRRSPNNNGRRSPNNDGRRSPNNDGRRSPNRKLSAISRQLATPCLCAQDGRGPLVCPLPCGLFHGGGLGRGPLLPPTEAAPAPAVLRRCGLTS